MSKQAGTVGESITSKYVKPTREVMFFKYLAIGFLVALFVMPQYFGIPLPVFDFTILRIFLVMLTFAIIMDKDRRPQFLDLIFKSKGTLFLIPYLIVLVYTMVLRVDFNAFLNPFIELFCMYLMMYIIKYSLGVERTIRIIIVFSYILAVLGLVEYVIDKSPFAYLETIKGIYTGQFIRSGHYRIMGPCAHSLGYGLVLICVLPFACFDLENKKIALFKNPVLLVMLILNIVFTGSRSTLSVFFVEIFLLFLLSDKEKKKKYLSGGIFLVVAVALFLVVFKNTGVAQYILLQVTTIIDELFGTDFSAQFGAGQEALGSSSNYREQLKYIFQVDWLNPFLGIGRKRSFSCEINGSFIQSVDNYYIAEYVRYAYPGLITYIVFVAYYVISIVKKAFWSKNGICKMLFVSVACYLINLFWLDSLQTLKYLYIPFAIFAVMSDTCSHTQKKASKYIREK